MLNDLAKEFGDNPLFQKMMKELASKMVIKVANDLKFGDLTVEDDVTKSTTHMVFMGQFAFEFLRAINLNINVNNEMGVAEFLDYIQTLYYEGELLLEE